MLQSARAAKCMCCKLHVLQTACVANCTCYKVHMLKSAHVEKCMCCKCCKFHVLQSARNFNEGNQTKFLNWKRETIEALKLDKVFSVLNNLFGGSATPFHWTRGMTGHLHLRWGTTLLTPILKNKDQEKNNMTKTFFPFPKTCLHWTKESSKWENILRWSPYFPSLGSGTIGLLDRSPGQIPG